jgi:23S rRNA pseudouridine2605 synthase
MPDERALERLRKGVPLDGRRTQPADVILVNRDRRDADGVLLMTIREGRNRQVRRMCEAVGHPVQRLKRTRIGPISDRKLPVGAWRDLTRQEVAALRRAVERESE